jgi:DNA mismatch repair ATPase MutS
MKEAYCKFVEENNLSPFNQSKTQLNISQNSVYKTKDAKAIHQKVLSQISDNFHFNDSSNLWNYLPFTNNVQEIKKRQEFFKTLKPTNNSFLKLLKKPRQTWSPKYEIIAVTENEETFVRLNEIGCSTRLLSTEYDLQDLEKYDIVQVIDCDNFQRALDSLPQSLSMDNIDDIYLERYLEILSSWKENLEILKQNTNEQEILDIIHELLPLFPFLEERTTKIIKREDVHKTIEEINNKIEEKIKDLSISGSALMKILSEGKLPQEFQSIVTQSVKESSIPEYVFNLSIPVSVDEKELDELIKRQSATEYTDLAEDIKSRATLLKSIPKKLQRISNLLLTTDFLNGISNLVHQKQLISYPEQSNNLTISNSNNVFLENPQPISFNLTNEYRCSILTGANSGGKTTLLEHVIQLLSLFQLGLPISGQLESPIFQEIYYFAKNKGAANRGAFENLLTQMSQIKPGAQTLILADEIEAVTEPGVAGKIIASTAEYFLNKNCFLIIATHLGYEIKDVLPQHARIDGIEAKGLDKDFNLIVDHNPVIGRLANSTPELIVEKMANVFSNDYFKYLNEKIKK